PARHVDAEAGVGDALGQDREHDEAGNDELPIAHAANLNHARAEHRAEDYEVERGREHRREQALPDGATPARHLETIDGLNAVYGHLECTRETQMSPGEDCSVWRSL